MEDPSSTSQTPTSLDDRIIQQRRTRKNSNKKGQENDRRRSRRRKGSAKHYPFFVVGVLGFAVVQISQLASSSLESRFLLDYIQWGEDQTILPMLDNEEEAELRFLLNEDDDIANEPYIDLEGVENEVNDLEDEEEEGDEEGLVWEEGEEDGLAYEGDFMSISFDVETLKAQAKMNKEGKHQQVDSIVVLPLPTNLVCTNDSEADLCCSDSHCELVRRSTILSRCCNNTPPFPRVRKGAPNSFVKRKQPFPILITGTPRSGTVFMKNLFWELGIKLFNDQGTLIPTRNTAVSMLRKNRSGKGLMVKSKGVPPEEFLKRKAKQRQERLSMSPHYRRVIGQDQQRNRQDHMRERIRIRDSKHSGGSWAVVSAKQGRRRLTSLGEIGRLLVRTLGRSNNRDASDRSAQIDMSFPRDKSILSASPHDSSQVVLRSNRVKEMEKKADGMVSWMHICSGGPILPANRGARFGKRKFRQVYHQIRDPLKTVTSIAFTEPLDRPGFMKFVQRIVDFSVPVPLTSYQMTNEANRIFVALEFYLKWNQFVQGLGVEWFRLEDVVEDKNFTIIHKVFADLGREDDTPFDPDIEAIVSKGETKRRQTVIAAVSATERRRHRRLLEEAAASALYGKGDNATNTAALRHRRRRLIGTNARKHRTTLTWDECCAVDPDLTLQLFDFGRRHGYYTDMEAPPSCA